MACMSGSIWLLSVVNLENAALVFVLVWVGLVLHKLVHDLVTLLLAALSSVHTTLFASLVHEVALLGGHCAAQIRVAVVVLLYLFGDASSSHKPFFFGVLCVGLVSYFSVAVKVLAGLDHLGVSYWILFALHVYRGGWRVTYYVLVLVVVLILLLQSCLLPPPLLHRYLLGRVVWCIQTGCSVGAKNSFVYWNLAILWIWIWNVDHSRRQALVQITLWTCSSWLSSRVYWTPNCHGVESLTTDTSYEAVSSFLSLSSDHEIVYLLGLIWTHNVQTSTLRVLNYLILVEDHPSSIFVPNSCWALLSISCSRHRIWLLPRN